MNNATIAQPDIFNLDKAKELAQQGIKVTHAYFTSDEYMTMRGNIIIFEDGVKIYFDEWTKGKEYLLKGWSVYKELDMRQAMK